MSGKFSDQPDKATPASGDLFPLVDVAAPATLKKITWINLVSSIKGALSWETISSTVAGIVATLNGLGNSATRNVGTAVGTICAGDDARLSDSRKCNNTFDDGATARGNLGLNALANKALTADTVLYIDHAGVPQALALGAVGSALMSTGPNSAPSFQGLATGAPAGYISGLGCSYAGTTSFGVGAGMARDDADSANMALASAFTKTTSPWSQGSGNGSLDTGSSLTANSYYYIWLIEKTDKSAVDVLISASSTAPTMPSGWSYKRVIGRFYFLSAAIDSLTVISANPDIGGAEVISSTRSFYYPPWDSSLTIEVVGGGGGGGGGGTSGTSYGGSGGGGGGYCRHKMPNPKTTSAIAVTIGASSTGAGNASSFGALMTGYGGGAGSSGSSANMPGGAGGTASGGNVCNVPGGRGSNGGSSNANGTPGGSGGNTPLGGGGVGGYPNYSTVGTGGGGGGGGGVYSDSNVYSGRAGGAGMCFITFG